MNLHELTTVPGWECIADDFNDAPVSAGYTSDLLSDVMAHAPEGGVLVTLQAHLNTIAVAALAGIRAVIVCHARPIPDDMIEAARREKILLLRTAGNQFDTTVILHRLLNTMLP